MTIATDFEIQNDKDIRWLSGGNYTVLALHQWLRDVADDATPAGADDFMDVTRPTPSDKSFDTIINLINGYNIDATAAQHLYGGSIIQAGGAEIYDGIQVLAPAGMRLEVIQNGALVSPNFWTTGLNADAANGISHQFILRVRTAGADIDGRRLVGTSREFNSLYLEFKVNGTARGVNVMAFTGWGTDLNNATAAATVAGWTDIVNSVSGYNGIDVNADGSNEFYYSKWDRASRTINQFYERMKWLTRRGTTSTLYGLNGDLFRGITHEVVVDTPDDTGAIAMSVGAGLTFERATGSFVTDGFVAGQKIRSTGFTNAGNNADKVISTVVALTITVTSTTGMVAEGAGTDERIQGLFDASEKVTWTGGTGQMLATDSQTAPTKLWIQLLTGVVPADGVVVTGDVSLSTVLVNVTVTERSVSAPFSGQSTGSALIGAYGFGVEALDLGASDKVTALDNVVYQAPNNVTFSVGGLTTPTEDYVLVGPRGYRFFYDNEATGPFTVGETLTFTAPAGTAKLADLLDLGLTGEMFIGPMLTGAAPADNSTIAGATATADVNGTVFDDINLRQMTLSGALTGVTTSVVVVEAIPTDSPSTGTIRIKRTSGKYTRHPYSNINYGTKTFTITSHDFTADTAPNGSQVFISYIDSQPAATPVTFTGVYSADRALFIRVRNGGTTSPIKTFETTGTLGSAGGSTTAVRTSDA